MELHLTDGKNDYVVEKTNDGLLVTPWKSLTDEQKQVIYKSKSEQGYA